VFERGVVLADCGRARDLLKRSRIRLKIDCTQCFRHASIAILVARQRSDRPFASEQSTGVDACGDFWLASPRAQLLSGQKSSQPCCKFLQALVHSVSMALRSVFGFVLASAQP
jgi:hypothetical protein